LYRLGARSLGALPCSHADSQNFARLPLPTVTHVHALNNCLSASPHGTSVPTHGLLGSLHWYHSHLNPCWTVRDLAHPGPQAFLVF
jgi:hypothetical protein